MGPVTSMIVQNDDQIYEEFGPPQGMLLLGDFPAMFALQELQSSYVNGDFMAVVLLAQTFSVFAWVKVGLPGQVIISQTNGTGTGRSWLCTDPSDGKFMTGLRATSRGGYALMSQSVITNSNWHREDDPDKQSRHQGNLDLLIRQKHGNSI